MHIILSVMFCNNLRELSCISSLCGHKGILLIIVNKLHKIISTKNKHKKNNGGLHNGQVPTENQSRAWTGTQSSKVFLVVLYKLFSSSSSTERGRYYNFLVSTRAHNDSPLNCSRRGTMTLPQNMMVWGHTGCRRVMAVGRSCSSVC